MCTQFVVCPARHCFIKGRQQGAFNSSVAVAVPVSARILREERPVSDILDFDPAVSGLEECLGNSSVFGRMHIAGHISFAG